MQIEIINIQNYENSLIKFVRRCNKKSIIIIKNQELAKFLLQNTGKLELEQIEKSIFLLKSIEGEYTKPDRLEEISTVYYIYSSERRFCINSQIVESISNEQIATFLEEIDYKHRKWTIFSRKFVEGKLYLILKPKWARGGKTEFWFSDMHTCVWDVDKMWADYVYNVGLKPLLKDYFN